MFDRLNSGVFWDESLNLVLGCTPVMPHGPDKSGCRDCWSATETAMRQKHPNDQIRTRAQGLLSPAGYYNGTIRLNWDAIEKPRKARKGKVYCIWTDLFHTDVPNVFIDAVLKMVAQCPQHIFIVVSKRFELAIEKLYAGAGRFLGYGDHLHNLWFLATVECQEVAGARISSAFNLKVCGLFNDKGTWPVVGILAEPLLGPLDLWQAMYGVPFGETGQLAATSSLKHVEGFGAGLDWIICGGESGWTPRASHPQWFTSLCEQATASGIPFTFKGWGAWRPAKEDELALLNENNAAWLGRDGKARTPGDTTSVPAPSSTGLIEGPNGEVLMRRCGRKKDAGRELVSRIWDGLPTPLAVAA